MPYKLDGNCVVNAETGKPVPGGCHATPEEAGRHLAALQANAGEEHKYPDRAGHKSLPSSPLNLLVGSIHRAYTLAADELFIRGYISQDTRIAFGGLVGDLLGALRSAAQKDLPELEAVVVDPQGVDAIAEIKDTNRFAVFKDTTGRYRWVAFSSSAYRDRDREIVSTKALADDVARADRDGEYGPLRWWHEPGADLGVCDFNALEGRVLVESGTFDDERYGERFKAYADDLEISLGFTHPPDEPDRDGVYNHIRRFERSLVPRGRASNLLTQLVVSGGHAKKERDMDKEKETKLRQFLGDGLADRILGKAKDTQKAADVAGLQFKTADPPDATAGDPAAAKADDSDKPADQKPEAGEKPAAGQDPQAPRTIGGMTEEQLKDYVAKCMEPYAKAMEELKAALSARKEAEDAAAAERTKAATDLAAAIAGLEEKLDTQGEALKLAAEGVAELKGELPRAQTKGFRPSVDGPEPDPKLKSQPAQNDPLAPFMNAMLGNGQTQQLQKPLVVPNAPTGQ